MQKTTNNVGWWLAGICTCALLAGLWPGARQPSAAQAAEPIVDARVQRMDMIAELKGINKRLEVLIGEIKQLRADSRGREKR